MSATEASKVRLTSYLSPELLAAIQRDATRKGQTLSVWMQRAAEAALASSLEPRSHPG
jgi:hypothetical protein